MEKYIENGQVAVLVSADHSVGWASENDYSEFLAMDKTLVDFAINGADINTIKDYLNVTLQGAYIDCSGWYGIAVEFVPVNTKFIIDVYDGSETLVTLDQLDIFSA